MPCIIIMWCDMIMTKGKIALHTAARSAESLNLVNKISDWVKIRSSGVLLFTL